MDPVMDICVINHGTIVLLWPQTRAGERWLRERTNEGAQWWGAGPGGLMRPALVVEPRYLAAIVAGAIADGLKVR